MSTIPNPAPEEKGERISEPDLQAGLKDQNHDLHKLIQRYQDTKQNEITARQMRQDFLAKIIETPYLLAQEEYSKFFADDIKPGDFAELRWQDPYQVVSFCEILYSIQHQAGQNGGHISSHINHLLPYALQQFERHGKLEKMFQLLQFAPTLGEMSDQEMLRLRNRAHLYEVQRIQRSRRLLYGYLIVQIFLIFLVFPFLFINAENGRIQRQIEETVEKVAEVELSNPGEERQFLNYIDGLYWSIITAGSIGYGDITPKTTVGKVIAAILGLMGVITTGVIAGLVLKWITPRKLD